MMNFSLSAAQEELRIRARKFARTEVLPASWHYDERDEIPLFLLERAREEGFLNHDIPVEYGGLGLGILESVLISEEIAAACPGVATSVFDNSLGFEPLLLCRNEALKKEYFRRILEEGKYICFATSEPTMGSNVAGMRCQARPDGDDFLLNGTKFWITNGGIADYMTVFATADPQAGHKGIGAFLVEKSWAGVEVGEHIPKLGQRCSNTAGLHFRNVRVPRRNVIAPPGEGFALAMKTFARTRPVIGAFAVGAARSAMEYAIDYAKKRQAFGAPLANFQAIQFKIAEMFQKVETARLLVWKAAWEADRGHDPTISASIAKMVATETAMEVVNEALQIFGGYGYTRLFPLEKLLRDVRLFTIYEGTSEVQRIVLAGHALEKYVPAMPALDQLPLMRGMDLNPASSAEGSSEAWRCRMCGHVHYGDEAPEQCPVCFFPQTAFKRIWPSGEEE
ncbi:MAG: acyl-CoA dehydrogenase family protein [Desulfuromonadales bacterium]|nr:acyl-CoA dehydrogenase family protein [Desulfuromonadales bacterium]MDW7757401.1 acyl-CoA dehydrogenase family protein [Desulfuromonadales bacterium]